MRTHKNLLRLIGLAILVLLFLRLDTAQVIAVLATASWPLLLLAVLLNLPQISLKVVRWQAMLRDQDIRYPLLPAILVYFGSIFIGLLTPGRLGEFVKVLHVKQDCQVSGGQAFSSVLVDRLFDLYMLLLVGVLALASASLVRTAHEWIVFVLMLIGLIIPTAMLVHEPSFVWLTRHTQRLIRRETPALKKLGSTITDLRHGLQRLSPGTLGVGILLTMLAYAVFFSQCYLTALAMGLYEASFVQISFAVALGSLITLLPISISGLGTREATIIAYLGTAGVSAEQSLGFSLLVFLTFYLGGGLLGAVAWLLKPVPLDALRTAQLGRQETGRADAL